MINLNSKKRKRSLNFMKIMHTADWHIGKLVHGVRMTNDQKYILEKMVQYMEEVKPDVLIIAGDLYDRSIPPTEAVALLNNILTEIVVRLKIKVIAIAGNHDSPERLNFGTKILEEKGLYILSQGTKVVEPIKIGDADGEVLFYPFPYMEPAVLRELYETDEINTHEEGFFHRLKAIKEAMDTRTRKVCIAHGYITGAESLSRSESERPLSIGGTEAVDVELFKGFNYVALGHLHQAQQVKYPYIRYAGSLMKYSFSEVHQGKSITVVDMDAQGKTTIEQVNFQPLKDMRRIKGTLKQLINPEVYQQASTEDYIMATLTDTGALIDPIGTLRQVYINTLCLERESICDKEKEKKEGLLGMTEKKPAKLFQEFYTEVTGKNFDVKRQEQVETIFNAVLEKERKE